MVTQYRHRTPREKAALESARIAVARAQAHAARKPDPVVAAPAAPVEVPVSEEPSSSAAAWRRRCRQIREEIEAAKGGDP